MKAHDRRCVALAAGLLLILVHAASAQDVDVIVGEDAPVGDRPEGMLFVEPHLAAHPTDPDRLLAVGWATSPDYSDAYCIAYTSSDGGETWAGRRLEGAGCADPWVTLTEERALLTMLGTHPALPESRRQLLAFFSDDGGETWSSVPQSMGVGYDGPRSVAGPRGTVFVTGGQGWRDPSNNLRSGVFVGRHRSGTRHVYTRNRLLPSNLNQVADGAAVLTDGALVVTYQDFQRPVGGPERAFRGRDGALETRRQWATISTDGGRSFSPPMLVTESCYDRPTFLAVDATSGPYRDRLYHVCAGDEFRTILVASSSDRGNEWTDAEPIEPPAAEAGSRREPVIAVNDEGVVAVAWMDLREEGPSENCHAPYIAVSADGGETFTEPERISAGVSCPDLSRLGRAGGRFATGGDYFGLAPAADGRFHVLWPDARDGVFTLRTTAVTVRPASE